MTASRLRKKIPSRVIDELRFAVDLRCCLCESRGTLPARTFSGQVHHLDGDRTNSVPANLVWLCLHHHEEAGKVGKSSRRLSRGVVARYRDHLIHQVEASRRAVISKAELVSPFGAALDAAIVVEVHKVRATYGRDWEKASEALYLIPRPEAMGFEARSAILEYLDDFAGSTRMRMPRDVAYVVSSVTLDVLPTRTLGYRTRSRLTQTDTHLLHQGLSIGTSLAYDGALYLKDLQIADRGLEILWHVLSLGVRRRSKAIREAAVDAFETADDGARRSGLDVASKLVAEARAHGQAGNTRYPDYSDGVFKAVAD